MSTPTNSRLSYADLEGMPDDGLRREIIDGQLYVTPSPVLRHQRVVLRLGIALDRYARAHGGEAFVAPLDVVFTQHDVTEPDVFYLGPHKTAQLGSRHVEIPPDLVVEVSSPGTRRRDLVVKRRLYARHGVVEYWFVDLDADRIEVYVLAGDDYAAPRICVDVVESSLPGLALDVSPLLAEN